MASSFGAAALVLVQLLLGLVAGQPVVSFPFNAQLPPVARTGSLFTYVFSSHTFTSDLSINYTLGEHPSWISLESSERKLYGIPDDDGVPTGDVVGQTVEIIATDGTGSVTMRSTVVVSREVGPSVRVPLSEQIDGFGPYSAPSSLLVYPSEPFTYRFSSKTFHHVPDMVNYYATSGNSSPLPAWIRFDASTLTFSGTTPGADDLFQSPQTFAVRLIASDIEGFSAATVDFSIVVGAHMLSTENPVIELNTSRGDSFEYDALEDGIKLDGKSVQPGDLNVTTTNTPAWLSFDSNTWSLHGTPRSDDHSANFTLTFTDSHSDSLDVMVVINVATVLFSSTFRDIEVTPGENFTLDLRPHFKDPSDVSVVFETQPDQDWLSLQGFILAGQVPRSASGEVSVDIEAASKSSSRRETESLTMTFLAPDGSTTTTPTTATAMPTGTSSNTGESSGGEDRKDGGIGTTAILLATLIPILSVALLAALVAFLIRRRRRRGSYLSKQFRSKISPPVEGSLQHTESGSDMDAKALAAVGVGARKGSPSWLEKRASKRASERACKRESKREPKRHSSPAPTNLPGFSFPGNRTSAPATATAPASAPEPAPEPASAADSPSLPPSDVFMHSAGIETAQSCSGTEGGSWFTTEETAVDQRSDARDLQRNKASSSRDSATTVLYSTHQILPTPPLIPMSEETTGFRNRLDLTIPTLDEISGMNATGPHGTRAPSSYYTTNTGGGGPRSEAVFSTMTTSSAALPGMHRTAQDIENDPTFWARPTPLAMSSGRTEGSEKDWSTIREDEDEEDGSSGADPVPELPRPPQVARPPSDQNNQASSLSSVRRAPPRSSHISFLSDTSFGSMENWRVLGRAGAGAVPQQQQQQQQQQQHAVPGGMNTVASAPLYSTPGLGINRDFGSHAGSSTAAPKIRTVHEAHEKSFANIFSGLDEEPDYEGRAKEDEEDDGLSAGAEACNWKRERESAGLVSERSFKAFL